MYQISPYSIGVWNPFDLVFFDFMPAKGGQLVFLKGKICFCKHMPSLFILLRDREKKKYCNIHNDKGGGSITVLIVIYS